MGEKLQAKEVQLELCHGVVGWNLCRNEALTELGTFLWPGSSSVAEARPGGGRDPEGRGPSAPSPGLLRLAASHLPPTSGGLCGCPLCPGDFTGGLLSSFGEFMKHDEDIYKS